MSIPEMLQCNSVLIPRPFKQALERGPRQQQRLKRKDIFGISRENTSFSFNNEQMTGLSQWFVAYLHMCQSSAMQTKTKSAYLSYFLTSNQFTSIFMLGKESTTKN
jgi:hypothetical protein